MIGKERETMSQGQILLYVLVDTNFRRDRSTKYLKQRELNAEHFSKIYT